MDITVSASKIILSISEYCIFEHESGMRIVGKSSFIIKHGNAREE